MPGRPFDARLVVAERSTRWPRSLVVPGLRAHPDALPRSASPWDKEFAFGMPAGYTITNAPTAWDVNRTVPGCLYVDVAADSTRHWFTWPTPPTPFTAIAKLAAIVMIPSGANNSQQPALILSTASPSTASVHSVGIWTPGDGTANVRPQAAGTSLASTAGFGIVRPVWLKLVVTSTTSVASYFSFDGLLWTLISTGVNPGFTIGSMGVQGLITGANPSTGNQHAWRYLRVTRP